MQNAPGETTAKIIEEEARQKEAAEKRVMDMVKEIEEVLLKHDATWLEWHKVVMYFNNRNDIVIPNLTVKFLKEKSNQ